MKIISIHLSLWLVFSLNIFVANGQKIADLPDADIKFSLVKWSFRTQTEMLCLDAKELGINSIEMVNADKWEVVSKHGLKVAVADGADLGIERGFSNREWHSVLQNQYSKILPILSEKKIPQLVCYSGLNTTLSNDDALKACVEGLKPIVQLAEQYGIVITMELISSRKGSDPYVKQTFPFYQNDNIEWGVELCKKINSPNFKLLYDIWHMNDMGRDVKMDIEKYHVYISHYQIAGIPSRNGIRKSDSFNYREVMQAVKNTGYRGFIGLEPDRVEKDIRKTIKESIELLTIKE